MRILRRRTKTRPSSAARPQRAVVGLSSGRSTNSPSCLALESRIMFDGAAVATESTVSTEQLAEIQAATSLSTDDGSTTDSLLSIPTGAPQFTADDQALFEALATRDMAMVRQEIVFISPSVRNYQQLLDGISANVEVIVLDPIRDGVTQMAEVLAGRTGIDAIHLIGEGSEAQMHLGTSSLTQDSISTQYATQFLQQIGQSLSVAADLLIYGCNFGRGEAGQVAIQTLATLTGADVAASTDLTGATGLGGDWVFEVTTGIIESPIAITAEGQATYTEVLDITTGLLGHWTFDANGNDSSGNSYNGTLTNGAFIDTTDVTDIVGVAKLSLDGTNDYVDLTTHKGNFEFLTQGSVAMWIRTTDTDGELFSLSDTANSDSLAALWVTASGKIGFDVWQNNANLLQVNSVASVNDGQWHHVAVTVNASGNKLYIDGVQASVNYVVGNATSTTFFDDVTGIDVMQIGRNSNSGGARLHYTGLIDDARVYNRALTSSDIAQLYVTSNDASINTVPGAQATNEDTNLIFSSGNSNQISITDVDAGTNPIEVTLSVTNGVLTLAGTTSLTFTTGDGTTDSTMTFRGTVTNINTALNGLFFTPMSNYSGGATLTLTTKDNTLVSLDIDSNLQAHYTFEGNANDVAPGTAQNGTLTNGATITTDGTRGQVVNLDGVDDFVDLSTHTASFAGYTQGTISGWIKTTGTFETIFSISDTADTGSYTALFLGVSGYLTYEVRENGVLQLAVYKSDITINDGNWHHVAVTVGPSGNRLYVDGALAVAGQLTYDAGNASTQHFFSSVSNLDAMALGRNQDSSGGKWYTTGNLDDVRLYDRVLTATEVATLAVDLSLTDTDTVAITVNAVNDAPTLTVSGNSTVSAGSTYTLNLSATDPEGVTISSWTINWGDGSIQTIAGNPSSVTHVYSSTQAGLTANITASATDADGTHFQNDLLVPVWSATDAVYRYDGSLKTFLGTFATGQDDHVEVVTGPDGNLYVSALGVGDDIVKYAPDGTLIGTFVANGTGGLSGAAGLAFGRDGHLYVTDYNTGNVLRFNGTTGAFIDVFVNGAANGISSPLGITFGPDGQLYVANRGTDSVLRFNSTTGVRDLSFNFTNAPASLEDIAFGPDGALYAADLGLGVLRYSAVNGTFLGTFVAIGSGGLSSPAGLTFGPNGNLYVADQGAGGAVRVYNGTTGAFLSNYVTGLVNPAYLNFAPSEQVLIASNQLVVNTTADNNDSGIVDGNSTHTISWLLSNKGADGFISLREAIIAANNTAGLDTIGFNIAAPLVSGAHTINVLSALPTITDSVILDGWSEPDFSSTPIIELNGTSAGAVDGLTLAANNSTIRGLVINRFGDDGLVVTGSGNTIQGNYIGTDVTGMLDRGNSFVGIRLDGTTAFNNLIGGTTAAERNLISGNNTQGVRINLGAHDNTVSGNYIGTTITGAAALANSVEGIRIIDTGTDHNTIGGTAAGAGNVIAFNTGRGLRVENGSGNAFLGNSIFSNGSLGIDLNVDGVTANDVGDSDSGVNNLQNFPVLFTASSSGGNTTITGTFNSTASTTFRIEFFSNTLGLEDASGHGEGQTYLGCLNVTTDGSGNASINTTLTGVTVAVNNRVTATATNLTTNDTSEFAMNVIAVANVAPVVSGAGGTLSYTEGDPATVIDGSLTITDVDSANITGAMVTISGGFVSGEDVLAVTNAFGVTGTYTAATGVLTLTGTATRAQYEQVLESVTYRNTNTANPNTGNRTVTWVVSDGSANSTGVTSTITVAATNDPPTVSAGGPYSIVEGQGVMLNASGSTDPDGDALTYAWDLDNDGSYGEVGEPTTVTPTLTWATLQSFGITDNGSYTIGLRVNDGTTSATTTTTLTVSNAAPTLTVTGNATASNGGVYTLNLSAFDPGADTISGWTINWGDGSVLTVAGNPSSVTHSYTHVGLTYNILVTATDEDGTFTNSEVQISSYGNDSIRQLDGVTGGLLGTLPVNAALDDPGGSVIGPDGRLYVSGYRSHNVVWYDLDAGTTGVFVSAGSGGLSSAGDVIFGLDGNLYVASYDTDQVLRYNGTTGAFIDVFATGALNGPIALTFGSDGHLYVGDWFGGKVYRFDGVSGAQIGTGAFATLPSFGVVSLEFGSDGHLYVGDGQSSDLLKFNGSTGAFMSTIDASITPYDIETGPDGMLYVTDFITGRVERFNPTTGTSLGFFDTGATGIVNPWGLAFTPGMQVTVVASVAPTITNLSGDSLSYTEGDGAVVIEQSGDALVADVDSADFNTGMLIVSFTAGSDSAEDVLAIRNQGAGAGQIGVSGSNVTYGGTTIGTSTGGSGGSNFVITLNSSATPTAVTALVQNITYQNTDTSAPTTGARTVRFVLTDGDGGTSANYDTTVTVSAVNDAPVLTPVGPNVTFIEGNAPVVIDALMTVTDVDSPNFDTGVLTVSITQNGTAADRLQVGNFGTGPGQVDTLGSAVRYQGTTIGTFSGGTSGSDPLIITFNGSATVTAVQAVVESIQFNNVSDTPSTLDREVTFALADGDGGTAIPQTKAVHVQATNDAPTATNLSAGESYTEDTALNLTDIVVTDVDSASVTVSLTLSDVAAGSLSTGTSGAVTSTFVGGVWTASGAVADVNTLLAGVTFTPSLNYSSNFTIATSVSDGVAPAVTGSKAMTGTAVNDAPTATNLSAGESYTEDTALNLTDIVVTDVDSASVTVTLTLSDVAAGSLSTGTSGAVTSTFVGGVWTASGAVADVNTLLAGVTFTPSLNYSSNFTIATSVSDGVAPAVTGSKAMTGTPVNDAPVVTSAALTVSEGQTVPVSGANFGVTDPDSASFTYTVSAVTGGYFQLTSAVGTPITTFTSADLSGGLVQFVDDGNEVAPSFSVTVNDGALDSNTLAATITYTPQNDAPVITSNGGGASTSVSVVENQTGVTTVTAGDVDVPADTLTYSIIGGADAGLVTINPTTGAVTFLSAPDFENPIDVGGDNIYDVTVQVSDGNGGLDIQAVAVTVTSLNDVPTLAVNMGSTVVQGLTDVITAAELQVADSDNTPAELIYTVTTPINGRLELATAPGVAVTTFTQADIDAGQVLFVHSGAVATTDSVTFTVSDGNGGTIGPATLAVTVTPFIPPPGGGGGNGGNGGTGDSGGTGAGSSGGQGAGPGAGGGTPFLAGNTSTPVLQVAPLPVVVVQTDQPARELSVVGMTREQLPRAEFPERAMARLEQPDLTFEQPTPVLPEILSVPVQKVLKVGHKLAERLTRLADDLERSVQEREYQTHLVAKVTTVSGVALSAGFVAWLLRGGSLVASFLVSMPAWSHFDPLPVLGGNVLTRRKRDRKMREADEQENKQFKGLNQVLKTSDQSSRKKTGRG